jgi:ABC-type sugar transport system substrate-binding protein
MKVVYYVPDITNPFWNEVAAGIEGRAKTEGITLEVVSASDGATQLAQLEAYQSNNPDGIFISPVDMNGIAPACRSILKAGVLILAIDQSLKPNVTGSVISGNMKGGMLAASYLADRLQVGSRVLHIKAEQDLQNVMLRSTSFDQEVKRRGLQITERIQADSQRNLSYEKTLSFLREKKPFDAIFAENDNMALGAVRALKEAGQTTHPLIIGYDGIPEALEAIRNGSMDATIAQNPIALGEAAMEVFLLALKHSPFEAVTTVMPRLITKSDLI